MYVRLPAEDKTNACFANRQTVNSQTVNSHIHRVRDAFTPPPFRCGGLIGGLKVCRLRLFGARHSCSERHQSRDRSRLDGEVADAVGLIELYQVNPTERYVSDLGFEYQTKERVSAWGEVSASRWVCRNASHAASTARSAAATASMPTTGSSVAGFSITTLGASCSAAAAPSRSRGEEALGSAHSATALEKFVKALTSQHAAG